MVAHDPSSLLGASIAFNLVCAEGHRHYSPTPQAFAGRECYIATGRTAEGLAAGHGKCHAPMHPTAPRVRRFPEQGDGRAA